jgi:uncharacterized membrane protein YfcA
MNRLCSFAAGTTTLSLTLLASSALAHPGHSLGDQGPVHLVTSPYHLALLAGTGAALWFGARFIGRILPRRAVQILGLLSVISAVVLWGLRA